MSPLLEDQRLFYRQRCNICVLKIRQEFNKDFVFVLLLVEANLTFSSCGHKYCEYESLFEQRLKIKGSAFTAQFWKMQSRFPNRAIMFLVQSAFTNMYYLLAFTQNLKKTD